MKKIQLITYEPEDLEDYNINIEISDFNKLKSLDNFEINIFNLTNNKMWTSNNTIDEKPSKNNCIMLPDFISIKQMLINSKKSKNIICLPQNVKYHCIPYGQNKYYQLKDKIPVLMDILKQLIPIEDIEIVYENSVTEINSTIINSAFYIKNENYRKLTYSKDSEKTTTISCNDNLIITTLDLIEGKEPAILFDYLNEIGLIKEKVEFPDWLYKYNFHDDETQKSNIEEAKEQIRIQKEIINQADKKIQDNMRYKSILYNNSDALVEVVFEILEFIFDISLDEFNDEKKEDFLFKKDAITYIGEIKGVTSNIKYEHISQLEVHYSKYLDKLQESNTTEEIKKILIMNYERTKDINTRDEINQMQIDLAIKNETLIIDTKTLLTLYERLLQGKITKDKVINYIKANSGIINLEEIN